MTDVAEIEAILKSHSSSEGLTLHEHMKTVFTQLIYDNPRDSINSFEELSLEVKQKGFSAVIAASADPVRAHWELVNAWITASKKVVDVRTSAEAQRA
jgi:uroporphyrinogen-III synthase